MISVSVALLLCVCVPALSTQLQVTDRPVTQQGLGGPKTAGVRGSHSYVTYVV